MTQELKNPCFLAQTIVIYPFFNFSKFPGKFPGKFLGFPGFPVSRETKIQREIANPTVKSHRHTI